MPIEHQQLLGTIKAQVEKVPERYEGYRKELVGAVAQIISLERDHSVSGMSIVRELTEQCDALAQLVDTHMNHQGDA